MKNKPTKFVFIIAGNIGSGKTSVAQELAKRMPDAKYLALDDFRAKEMHEDRNIAENKAQVALQKQMFDSDQVIYEMTHSFYHSSNLKKWRSEGYILFATKLQCSPSICRKRAKDRSTALPLPYVKDVSESIDVLHYKLQNFPAQVKISTQDNSPEEIVDEILNRWLQFNILREQNGA